MLVPGNSTTCDEFGESAEQTNRRGKSHSVVHSQHLISDSTRRSYSPPVSYRIINLMSQTKHSAICKLALSPSSNISRILARGGGPQGTASARGPVLFSIEYSFIMQDSERLFVYCSYFFIQHFIFVERLPKN